MHNIFDLHRSHREDSNVSLLILAMAVVGFIIYFLIGTPVEVHRTATGYPVIQHLRP